MQPTSEPIRVVTNFSDSLQCMDELFVKHQAKPVYFSSAEIPDGTNKAGLNSVRSMLISTIEKMSKKSNAAVFINIPLTADLSGKERFDWQKFEDYIRKILSAEELANLKFPDYFIDGAITQLDDNVISNLFGSGVDYDEYFGAGVSRDQIMSVITIDFYTYSARDGQVKESTNNAISIVRTGLGVDGDISGKIKKKEVGARLEVELDRSQGVHQAVRTLVELSAIELLGKTTGVPYWECLAGDNTKDKTNALSDSYNAMKPTERVAFAQTKLAKIGYYQGAANGVLDNETNKAIAHYQADVGLHPSGKIDFAVYQKLVNDTGTRKPSEAEPRANPAEPQQEAEPQQAEQPKPEPPSALSLEVTTAKGKKPTYQQGENLAFSVKPSQDAYIYCYYASYAGDKLSIIQLLPNEYQNNNLVQSNQTLEIPGQMDFDISLETPNVTEEIACIGTQNQVKLQVPALTPIDGVQSLEQVIQTFKNANVGAIAVDRIHIQIKP
jgi:peptidoglycan hydrolase-like protein with peptidoglycan-binding domain